MGAARKYCGQGGGGRGRAGAGGWGGETVGQMRCSVEGIERGAGRTHQTAVHGRGLAARKAVQGQGDVQHAGGAGHLATDGLPLDDVLRRRAHAWGGPLQAEGQACGFAARVVCNPAGGEQCR